MLCIYVMLYMLSIHIYVMLSICYILKYMLVYVKTLIVCKFHEMCYLAVLYQISNSFKFWPTLENL